MKKVSLLFIIFFFLTPSLFAHAGTEVSLRFGKQDGITRVVFEAEESFIKKANVTTSGTQIKIEFPSGFNLTSQKDFNLDTFVEDRFLIINLKEPFETKVLKLSSPPRLVIDISASKKETGTIQTDVAVLQKVFVLDPGHGGYDFGIINNDSKEKDIALSIARGIEAALIKKGKKVFLTRKGDQFLSLADRAAFANQKTPEIFISIHVSASESFALYIPKFENAGFEASVADLYSLNSRQKRYVENSKRFAESLGKAIKDEFNFNVILREMPLPILNSVGAPSVLIEVPSPKDVSYDQKARIRLMDAIIRGLSLYGQQ